MTAQKMLFDLGQIAVTTPAMEAMVKANLHPYDLLSRHITGDWGDIDGEDWATNDAALELEDRIVSSYEVAKGTRVWVMTEWDRSATTLLLPSEY